MNRWRGGRRERAAKLRFMRGMRQIRNTIHVRLVAVHGLARVVAEPGRLDEPVVRLFGAVSRKFCFCHTL